MTNTARRIWIDIDNAPHVLVLRPIILELQRLGHIVHITARAYGQVVGLLEMYGIDYRLIGRHAGKSKLKKVVFLISRSVRLMMYAFRKKYDIGFCHGSRALSLSALLLGLPLVVMFDYEFTTFPAFVANCTKLMLVPEVMDDEVIQQRGFQLSKLRKYPGLKEELYVNTEIDGGLTRKTIGIESDRILVLLRPPATMAHYHLKESESLFYDVVSYLASREDLNVLIVPRTESQSEELRLLLERMNTTNTTILRYVYHGPDLIRLVDVVISGGGTMNREAACIGVPVYSIYCGPIGSVDRYLSINNKLRFIEKIDQLKEIEFCVRKDAIRAWQNSKQKKMVDFIVESLLDVANGTSA